jgi:hypothetical protein
VSWFSRSSKQRPGTLRPASASDGEHLSEFVRAHGGVEAFLEPRTTVTETTVVLVAASGEWTRRRVTSPERAAEFARKHAIPLYDVAKVGYPNRMREWNRQRRTTADPGPSGLGTETL